MGNASSSRLDRLAALPALALVAYALLTLPTGGGARDPFRAVAGQLYAEAGRGHANAVLPEHVRVRAPDTFDPSREDDQTDTSELVPPTTLVAFAAAGVLHAVSHTASASCRFRTHNPREPPSYT